MPSRQRPMAAFSPIGFQQYLAALAAKYFKKMRALARRARTLVYDPAIGTCTLVTYTAFVPSWCHLQTTELVVAREAAGENIDLCA